jgi:hypothetical protein
MKYALLKYSTMNLGDEIQSIAARQFLPSVDYYVDRDRLNSYRFNDRPKIILNGWYTHRPESWPPEEQKYDPLIISFHISNEHGSSVEALTSPRALEYYKRHEPIGCRDFFTRDLLRSKGVDAYFSGCLTLTLQRDARLTRDQSFLAVDVPEDILEKLVPSAAARERIERVNPLKPLGHSQRLLGAIGCQRRYNFYSAGRLLHKYARARFVVTTRLHCALPCFAYGTPTLLILKSKDDPRFAPLGELFHSYTLDAIRKGPPVTDAIESRPNPGDTSELVSSLRSRIRAFV